jgi:hypothetical protein
MLALTITIEKPVTLPVESLRIIDFYHKFPWLLDDFKSTNKIKGFQKEKKAALKNSATTQFEIIPDKFIVFQRMHSSQLSSINALIRKKYFI